MKSRACFSLEFTAVPDQTVLTRAQIREIDRRAIEDYGIPGMVLMENASRAVAEVVQQHLAGVVSPHVVIIAGTGNNAGNIGQFHGLSYSDTTSLSSKYFSQNPPTSATIKR